MRAGSASIAASTLTTCGGSTVGPPGGPGIVGLVVPASSPAAPEVSKSASAPPSLDLDERVATSRKTLVATATAKMIARRLHRGRRGGRRRSERPAARAGFGLRRELIRGLRAQRALQHLGRVRAFVQRERPSVRSKGSVRFRPIDRASIRSWSPPECVTCEPLDGYRRHPRPVNEISYKLIGVRRGAATRLGPAELSVLVRRVDDGRVSARILGHLEGAVTSAPLSQTRRTSHGRPTRHRKRRGAAGDHR